MIASTIAKCMQTYYLHVQLLLYFTEWHVDNNGCVCQVVFDFVIHC